MQNSVLACKRKTSKTHKPYSGQKVVSTDHLSSDNGKQGKTETVSSVTEV